jgi:hypothetical protein
MGVRVRSGHSQEELDTVLKSVTDDESLRWVDAMKSITEASVPGTGTQFQPFNLDLMGKILLPELTPFGNAGYYSIETGETGDSYEYRAIVGKNAGKDSGFAGQATSIFPGSGDGLGNLIPYDFATRKKFRQKLMPLAAVTRELAESSGAFNAAGRMTIASLITAKELNERNVIWGSSHAISTPTNLAATGLATGGTLTTADSPYTIYVVALNYWGWWYWSGTDGAPTADVPQVVSLTTPGSSIAASTTASIPATNTTGSINATWDAMDGAHGYMVSMKKNGGTNYFVGYTNIPAMTIIANATTFTVAIPTGNGSNQDLAGNTLVIDGLVEQIWRDADLAGIVQKTPLAGIGGGFTATAGGCGIADFETYFAQAARQFKLSPDVGVVSPTTLSKISEIAVGASNVRRNLDAKSDGKMTAGTQLTELPNQYMGTTVPLMSHPLAPDAEVVWYVKDVDYPGANVGVNLQFHCTTHLLQVFFALMADVAPPGPWGIRTYGAAALLWGKPCGFQNNFY